MNTATTILWFLPSFVFGVGTVITIVALRRAPEGYQDEEGFHYLRSSHTPMGADAHDAVQAVHSAGGRLA